MPNPILPGWTADPELHFFENRFWIYPTTSLPFEQQTFFEAWSSSDLVSWTNEGRILDFVDILWSTQFAAWAPSIAAKSGCYYFYFSAGDGAGIGVAVGDSPRGPFRDALGFPLVQGYPHGAQAIDPHCFQDDDGQAYLYFGGHGQCVVARLAPTMRAFNRAFTCITPCKEFVEGPFMVKRRGLYYLMWSEGGWGDHSYCAAYGISDNPLGPFERQGLILQNDESIARAAGHHSVLQLPGTQDDWVICYHRRPLEETDANHRVTCLERLHFRTDGTIEPIVLSHKGVTL
jgi:beta-xylosidase